MGGINLGSSNGNSLIKTSEQIYYTGVGPADKKLKPVPTVADLPKFQAYDGMKITVLEDHCEYMFVTEDGISHWVRDNEVVNGGEF